MSRSRASRPRTRLPVSASLSTRSSTVLSVLTASRSPSASSAVLLASRTPARTPLYAARALPTTVSSRPRAPPSRSTKHPFLCLGGSRRRPHLGLHSLVGALVLFAFDEHFLLPLLSCSDLSPHLIASANPTPSTLIATCLIDKVVRSLFMNRVYIESMALGKKTRDPYQT